MEWCTRDVYGLTVLLEGIIFSDRNCHSAERGNIPGGRKGTRISANLPPPAEASESFDSVLDKGGADDRAAHRS